MLYITLPGVGPGIRHRSLSAALAPFVRLEGRSIRRVLPPIHTTVTTTRRTPPHVWTALFLRPRSKPTAGARVTAIGVRGRSADGGGAESWWQHC